MEREIVSNTGVDEVVVDLGYPWGRVRVPCGYAVHEVPAACSAESHENHPFCDPWWEQDLPKGAILLAPPVYTDWGWVALVAEPASPAVGGERYVHIAGGSEHGFLDIDDEPLLASPTDDYAWECTVCKYPIYYAYGEGMTDFIEDPQGVMCLEHTRILWPGCIK